jgi:hypothetical protein
LEARTGRPLGEDSRGVQRGRRARVIGAGFLEEDECWFGAQDGIRDNRPQLVHRQLEVTRACLHLHEFRTKASADRTTGRSSKSTYGYRRGRQGDLGRKTLEAVLTHAVSN